MKLQQVNPVEGRTLRECPGPDVWRSFYHGKVEAAEASHLEAHLADCADCFNLLTEFGNDDDTVVEWIDRQVQAIEDAPTVKVVSKQVASHRAALSRWIRGDDVFESRSTPKLPDDVPSQMGEYRLVSALGQGAVGRVFRAEHRRLKKQFAIKLLAPKQKLTHNLLVRFQREMEAVGKIEHPNVIGATDAGEAGGYHYLVMEFFDGLDLATVAARLGWLSVPDACEVVRQAALGIQAAHDCNLIHRDVKPSNLLLTERGVVKVLDLGLVALKASAQQQRENVARQVVGTPDFAAPEQWQGHAVDGRADVYGLGCTLYRLLTGRVPREHVSGGKTPPTQDEGGGAGKRAGDPSRETEDSPRRTPPMTSLPKLADLCDAPAELCAVVEKALAPNPADRTASPAVLAEELAAYSHGADLTSIQIRAKAYPLSTTLHGGHDTTRDDVAPMHHAPTPDGRFAWTASFVPAIMFVALAVAIAVAAFVLNRETGPRWITCVPDELRPFWTESGWSPEVEILSGGDRQGVSVFVDDRTLLDVGEVYDDTYRLICEFSLDDDRRKGLFFGGSLNSADGLRAWYVQVRRMGVVGEKSRYVVTLHNLLRPAEIEVSIRLQDLQVLHGEILLPTELKAASLETRVSAGNVELYLNHRLVARTSDGVLGAGYALPLKNLSGKFGLYLHAGKQEFSHVQLLDN